jgi:ankyrin repeat protein
MPEAHGLEGLKKLAKRWLRAVRAGDRDAIARLDRALPRRSAKPALREVQQAIARERGFASWAALKESFEAPATADELLLHACLFSPGVLDFAHKWRRAERLRERMPELARVSMHTAVVCGDVAHAKRLVADNPDCVNEKAGPMNAEPLVYLCASRVKNPHAVALAELLLDAGADAKAAYLDREYGIRFSALCCVMGKGEMGAPEHPDAERIARMLLDRGADPNESQGIYDTSLAYVGDDTRWLEILFEYGLTKDHPINWHFAPKEEARERIVDFALVMACSAGHARRVRCLLLRGADPNAVSRYDGHTCHQNAVLTGRLDIAELLAAHGARVLPLDGADAFVAACSRVDRAEAERLLAGHPEYLENVDPLFKAVHLGQLEVLRLLLDLGMDPNRENRHGNRALNDAATDRAASDLLLAHGADPRGRAFGGTPQNWARLAGNLEMARFHAEKSRYILDAVASGHVALARDLVALDPSCAGERSPAGDTVLHVLPADATAARALLDLLLPLGADPSATNVAGKTPEQSLLAVGADDVAALLRSR